ncbi:glycosyltransferase family 9 protein [Schlesneria sp. T3-172]|uniref:glycosyltransferase family 9 protein n=1 Tax=Schlesneria sphaerica TaxID=3373610 RepID=UPI0037CA55D7
MKFRFDRHGLGDVVHFAHAVQLYRSRGYDVTVQVEDNKEFVWQVAEVNTITSGELPNHVYGYPHDFDNLDASDAEKNKVAFGLHHPALPPLGLTADEAWDELCSVRISATEHITEEAREEARKFLDGMPKPIICIHSRGTNWHERKSLSADVALDVIVNLINQTGGSVIVLDYDCRAPMVGHERCKGIKPSWGHIGVDRLCALYELSDLMIGVDSGPFHVAAMTDVKALGVFRSLHPVRVCLPSPNATYLASARHQQHWEQRADRWRIVTYAGDEPTAEDITHEALLILSGTDRKMHESLSTKLAGVYEYARIGYDKRRIELLPDGKIGDGRGDCEQRWFAREERGRTVISISGKFGVICECSKGDEERVFKGQWTHFERMPIELRSASEDSTITPSRITLVTNWDDAYNPIASIVMPNRVAYAARHGYQIIEKHYEGAWGKLNALLDAWDSADWLWWLDMDACITDSATRLESLIDLEADVVLTCDRNGLSSGAMLIRTVPAVREILEDLLLRRHEFDWPNGLWEQNGLMWLLWKIKDRVKMLPQSAMNSYAGEECPAGSHAWQPGDFVIHCAGLSNEQRIRILTERSPI